ncbi:hypothetical protein OF83DRAFT_1178608 [Amylostereum chailletii]|nr:hypothetical protein OF83DRAFT_1178608 [Amylostereum chailletii]
MFTVSLHTRPTPSFPVRVIPFPRSSLAIFWCLSRSASPSAPSSVRTLLLRMCDLARETTPAKPLLPRSRSEI